MQDLFQNYVGDVKKLRDALDDELRAQARELSKAMDIYAQLSEAALASLMEKVSARGAEVEAAAAARLDQFRGLPANRNLPHVSDEPLPQAPTNADQERITAAAERALADGLHIESDGDRKPKSGRPSLLNQTRPPEAGRRSHLGLTA
jgi:hypothetical protein